MVHTPRPLQEPPCGWSLETWIGGLLDLWNGFRDMKAEMNERSILLVEDSPDDRELMTRAIKRCRPNQTVLAMADSVEALEFLIQRARSLTLRRSSRPSLVLVDLKMPKLNGLEFLNKVRASPETLLLPVVILSSSSSTEDVARAYASGANGYVVKPVEFDRFVQVMESLCSYWLDCDALSHL